MAAFHVEPTRAECDLRVQEWMIKSEAAAKQTCDLNLRDRLYFDVVDQTWKPIFNPNIVSNNDIVRAINDEYAHRHPRKMGFWAQFASFFASLGRLCFHCSCKTYRPE